MDALSVVTRDLYRGYAEMPGGSDVINKLPSDIRAYFGYAGVSDGTETKVFGEPENWNSSSWQLRRRNGVPKVTKATRKAVLGSPNL